MGGNAIGVSVIVPTHNRATLLGRALRSVQAQSLPPLELIVVDDGSNDGTEALVARDFPAARYIRQSNHGVSSARNRGIRAARGEWIALLDSDDEWLPGKLEAQLGQLRTGDCLISHTEEIWVRNGVRVNPMRKHRKYGGDIFPHCLPLCVISPSAALIHRDLFDRAGLFDEHLPACEDYDLWLRICAHHRVDFVKQPQIVKYGGHADQLSRRHWGMDRFRVQALEKLIGSGELNRPQLEAARATLAAKAAILANGAEKRGRHAEAGRYRRLQHVHAPAPDG
ncbi:MAG: glycosyltransferase family A protein [Candidatus Sedimenticola endophacoides]